MNNKLVHSYFGVDGWEMSSQWLFPNLQTSRHFFLGKLDTYVAMTTLMLSPFLKKSKCVLYTELCVPGISRGWAWAMLIPFYKTIIKN